MGLSLTLERTAGTELFRQIADAVHTAIADGQITPGARLPSARELSDQLCVGRGTVEGAYAMLAEGGAVVNRRGGGTIVSGNAGTRLVAAEATPFMFAPDSAVLTRRPIALRPRLPALDAFPIATWSRLLAEAA